MEGILKCKICGGDLEPTGEGTAICLYCGTKQILPKLTSERKASLYDRADHNRRISDFDKAAALYEQMLVEDDTDAEVYWDLVLCRYGIEYVEDPRTKRRIPTVNRTQLQSIFDDHDYKLAIKHASPEQRSVIEAEAKIIDGIQRNILDISSKEEPYDIFICYKETDDGGKRTIDSVIAQDVFSELTHEGYKVFFSRISLEDKLGSEFEPYIFAALNSAKIMIVIGTRAEHFNSVWVKNEWSRYIGLINSGEKKTLIPAYKDMDPYDLPDEFSHLQAQNMNSLGCMQDLIRGIDKILSHSTKSQSDIASKQHNTKTSPKRINKIQKRILAATLLGICLIAVCVVGLKALNLPNNPAFDSNYRTGEKYLKEGNYEEAVNAFNEIGDSKEYKENAVKSAYYEWGKDLLEKGNFEDAMDEFSHASGYADADEQKIEAIYEYVESVKEETITQKTQDYCDELIALNYKDSKELYDYIVQWKHKLIVNHDEDDNETDIETAKKGDTLYVHFFSWGGPLNDESEFVLRIVPGHMTGHTESIPTNSNPLNGALGNSYCYEVKHIDYVNELNLTVSLLYERLETRKIIYK